MFSSKKLYTVLAASGLSFAAACGSDGGGVLTRTCFGSNTFIMGDSEACANVEVAYEANDLLEGLPSESTEGLDEAAAVAGCFLIGVTDASPSSDEVCPGDLEGTAVGTCSVTIEVNPDAAEGEEDEDALVTITSVSGDVITTDANEVESADAEDVCDTLDNSDDPGDDAYIFTTTYTAAE